MKLLNKWSREERYTEHDIQYYADELWMSLQEFEAMLDAKLKKEQ